ncbi:MAG TPA: protein kinase [Gemmatimonadales bacterium]|nr:protein kinase [Gemmatimonadales bacterium]
MQRLTTALSDRYAIERELGAGGMATVYLALDIKHHRKVAIKVLKPELAAVLGADRFVQEITTTAALQHPHILPLFDSGESDGFLWYVMPFIDGETLRAKLDRETQLGIDESVRITTDVASALHYAHTHGVIHRDIKPENILLHDGRPMVADFGIALAVSAAAGGRMTETGLSLGTPHYMSPEQATAEKEITARSDVYSLGSVLYEMLTGNPPHTGANAQQIIMKIVTEDAAPVTKLRRSVPANIAAAVAKSIEKLPADRFDSAKAFADALVNPGFTTAGTALGIAGSQRATVRAQLRSPLVLGLGAALIAAIGFAWHDARREAATPVVRFQVALPSMMLIANAAPGRNMAVSPDGRTLAFTFADSTAAVRLSVRRVDEATIRTLAGTDGAQQPAFSPDGEWIAYMVGTTVWKIALAGGSPVMVGDAGLSPVGVTWSSAGVILIGGVDGLLALPASGGPPELVAVPDTSRREVYFNGPLAMPDGETVLVSIQSSNGMFDTRLGAVSLTTGEVRRYDLDLFDIVGYIDGTLVYILPTGALMAITLDLDSGHTSGNAVALGPTVVTTVVAGSQVAMSTTGTLVYQPADDDATLGWVDRDGRFSPLLSESQGYGYPRLSPDGDRIAVTFGATGRADIWLYDIASSTPTRLTNAGGVNDRPEWTPDGRRVVYRTDRNGRPAIWWQRADLGGVAEPLQAGAQHSFFEGVITPDGRTLVYQIDDAAAQQADILYRSLDGDTSSHPVAATRFVEAQARVSPDGKWITYVTDASGTSQVVAQSFPSAGGRVQVSASGGSEPVWSRDGETIYYRDGRHLVAASVSTGERITVTNRKELFPDNFRFSQAPHANYDVAPDGQRFLMVRSSRTPEYQVVFGWATELRSRMQAGGAP